MAFYYLLLIFIWGNILLAVSDCCYLLTLNTELQISSRSYMVNYEQVIAQETCLVAPTGFSYILSLENFRGGKL